MKLAAGGLAISIIVAGLQYFSPQQHRGRIMSFYIIISQTIPATSGIAAGIFAQILSPSTALIIFGLVIIFLVLLTLYKLQDIKQLEHFHP
ncbi:MAG: MFS transporter [Gammaproteobacteria bacterium]|nr:MFS transporter [Gammaproteobacteria bacterium]